MDVNGDRGARAARLIVPLAFAAPLAARALSFVPQILDRDEAYWLSAAMRMRDTGLPPYLAGWDSKPPLPFLFHRLALAISPERPLLAAHVAAGVLAGVACVLVALAARRLAGPVAGALAALVFVLLDSTGAVRAMAANTELLTYVPVAAGLLLVAGPPGRDVRTAVAAGACAAVAALAKQPAVLFGPAFVVALLLTRRPSPARAGVLVLASLAGVALVLGPVLGWLALRGAWQDFWLCTVEIGRVRAGAGFDLEGTGGLSRWIAVARANPVAVAGALALPVAAFAGTPPSRAAATSALRAAGPVLLTGLAAAIAGGAAYQHYLQMSYPAAAICAGVAAAALLARLPATWALRGTVATAVAAVLAAAPDRLGQWRSRDWTLYESAELAALRRHFDGTLAPSETVFVWGMHPDLYVITGRTAATRMTSCAWLAGTFTGRPPAGDPEPRELVPGAWDRLFADLGAAPPAVIVDSAPAGIHGFDAFPLERFPRLREWIVARYDAEPWDGRYRLWRRR